MDRACGRLYLLFAIYRCFADICTMSVTQEIIVRKSKLDKIVGYVIILAGFVGGIYILAFRSFWIGLIGILSLIFLLANHNKEYKVRQILLKIAPVGLWTPRHGYRPWKNISKVCFARIYSGKTYKSYVEIYKGNPFNPDEVIDISSINILKFRLKRELRKYVQVESVTCSR
jgi:hypothetical protein